MFCTPFDAEKILRILWCLYREWSHKFCPIYDIRPRQKKRFSSNLTKKGAYYKVGYFKGSAKATNAKFGQNTEIRLLNFVLNFQTI